MEASNASHKLKEVHKIFTKGGNTNESWLNGILKFLLLKNFKIEVLKT